jgi:peroxiredoxin Q/BCP
VGAQVFPVRPAVVVLLLVALGASSPARAQEVAEVGYPPPLFALPDEHGEVHALGDMLGRPIILYFTHNQCHYCSQVIAFLKRAHARYEGTDLTIVTLNVWADDATFIRRYKEAFGLPFDMLAGKDVGLLRSYEVNYVPIVVFIGRDGTIRHLYHHYILQEDFERSTAEILEVAR